MKKVIVKKNRYVDSVSLMSVGDKVKAIDGVEGAEVNMATAANLEILADLQYTVPAGVTANDLVIAVTGSSEEKLEAAIKLINDILDHKNGSGDSVVYHKLDEIDLKADGYDLAQISLPGEYAYDEAKKALDMGLDVFIFSDNVPMEQEKALKEYGLKTGHIVMGPDCGVGLIDGVALAAGSIIRKGPVGIVGASGSGAQEVGCIIEKCGSGVSSIIGTGGHDLYPEIGGISMLMGMKKLEADPDTQVIVLVSKLADLGVMANVLTEADKLKKPCVAVFLGSDEKLFAGHKVHAAYSLEGAALEAVGLVTGKEPKFGFTDAEIDAIVKREVAKYDKGQKYMRGLFCGGTFTEEAMIYYTKHNKGTKLYSNLSTKYAEKLADSHKSVGDAILDLGAEDFTAEAPHPVFDPSLRLKRLYQELADPAVAFITLDFITGPGVHRDPITSFAAACKKAVADRNGKLTFIANICGSYEDPQNIVEKEKILVDAGVIVTKSNYQSTKLSSALLRALEERQ